MRWLLDNMVPRSVLYLLRGFGEEADEVRAVLVHDATDGVVAAYAEAQGYVLVTHDKEMSGRMLRAGQPHVWLRTQYAEDRDRLNMDLASVAVALSEGALRVTVTHAGVEIEPERPDTAA